MFAQVEIFLPGFIKMRDQKGKGKKEKKRELKGKKNQTNNTMAMMIKVLGKVKKKSRNTSPEYITKNEKDGKTKKKEKRQGCKVVWLGYNFFSFMGLFS